MYAAIPVNATRYNVDAINHQNILCLQANSILAIAGYVKAIRAVMVIIFYYIIFQPQTIVPRQFFQIIHE